MQTAAPTRPFLSRPMLVIGAAAGALLAFAIVLWARYGSAVFHEILASGLALCF